MKSFHNFSFLYKHSIYLREIADEPNDILMNLDICGRETSFNMWRIAALVNVIP